MVSRRDLLLTLVSTEGQVLAAACEVGTHHWYDDIDLEASRFLDHRPAGFPWPSSLLPRPRQSREQEVRSGLTYGTSPRLLAIALIILSACVCTMAHPQAKAALVYSIRILGANVSCLGRPALTALMKTTKFLVGPTINIVSALILLWEAALGLLVSLRILPHRPN